MFALSDWLKFEAHMKILHLTLKKKWFDLIAKGEKRVEYRKYNDYWIARLSGKTFDEIHFRNGYTNDRPFMRVQYLGCQFQNLNYVRHFVLLLGKILEIRNYVE